MNQTLTHPAPAAGAQHLERQVRELIDSLSYLPTTVGVAMKFVELGRNPDAEPSDYAKIISADNSLSAKILALANSSWFGVRNKVGDVKTAVNLLGLGTIRTLAISYCMTGLHNELKLGPDESRMFWEAALCKAVAAKHYLTLHDKTLGDQGFLAGMFQDMAIPILYAAAKEPLLQILQDPTNDVQMQLERERYAFGLDHTEVGRILGQKLELPDSLVDVVAFHHNGTNIREFVEDQHQGDAVQVASLFPHLLRTWNRRSADELCRFLEERAESNQTTACDFLAAAQEQFDQLYGFFQEGSVCETKLGELMQESAREAADNTTHLVSTVQQLMQQVASAGIAVSRLADQRTELEDKASHDSLTGLLNREGFTTQATELLQKAVRYGVELAIVYVDLDDFKQVNDRLGHEFGDLALKKVATHIAKGLHQHDLAGRVGGDEFVVFLYECSESDARRRAESLVAEICAQAANKGESSAQTRVSVGCLSGRPSGRECKLDSLLTAADKLMYKAKKAGGNRVESRAVRI